MSNGVELTEDTIHCFGLEWIVILLSVVFHDNKGIDTMDDGGHTVEQNPRAARWNISTYSASIHKPTMSRDGLGGVI